MSLVLRALALCVTSDFDLAKLPMSDLGLRSVNCKLEKFGMGIVEDEESLSKPPKRSFCRGVIEPGMEAFD